MEKKNEKNTQVLPTQEQKKRHGLIRAVAFIQSAYALIELSDCIMVVLMALGLAANIYPKLLFQEMQYMFDQQSVWLIPLFLFYTSLRIISAIGLWKNLLWGFWLTIFVSCATLIMAPFMLPMTAAEMLMNGIIVIFLLVAFFGERRIIS